MNHGEHESMFWLYRTTSKRQDVCLLPEREDERAIRILRWDGQSTNVASILDQKCDAFNASVSWLESFMASEGSESNEGNRLEKSSTVEVNGGDCPPVRNSSCESEFNEANGDQVLRKRCVTSLIYSS